MAETKFKQKLQRLKSFLTEKRKINTLAQRCGVDPATVQSAFKAETKDDLRGKRLEVINEALKMRDEIEADIAKLQNL